MVRYSSLRKSSGLLCQNEPKVRNSFRYHGPRYFHHSALYTNAHFFTSRIYLKQRLIRICTEMLCSMSRVLGATTRSSLKPLHKVTLKLLGTMWDERTRFCPTIPGPFIIAKRCASSLGRIISNIVAHETVEQKPSR